MKFWPLWKLSMSGPWRVAVCGKPLKCVVCGGDEFRSRTFKHMDIGPQTTLGVICARCGFVHEFGALLSADLGDAVELYDYDESGAPARPSTG